MDRGPCVDDASSTAWDAHRIDVRSAAKAARPTCRPRAAGDTCGYDPMRRRLTAAVTALLALSSCGQHDAAPNARPEAQPSSLTAEAAYERAVILQRSGSHLESVPFFRRAVEEHPNVSQLHLEYGEALYNAAFQTDLRFGFVRFVVPQSRERIMLTNAAIQELRRAVDLAQTPDEQAYARFVLGRTQSMIGLQADALESISAARTLAPNVPVLRDLEASTRAILAGEQRTSTPDVR